MLEEMEPSRFEGEQQEGAPGVKEAGVEMRQLLDSGACSVIEQSPISDWGSLSLGVHSLFCKAA